MASSSSHSLQQELIKARQEIQNLRKKVNALQQIQRKEIDKITQTLDNWQCSSCKKREQIHLTTSVSISNQSKSNQSFEFNPIGVINSEFPEIRGTPRQPTVTMNHTKATLTLSKDIFTNPSHSLQDLDNFSHLWIIFAFHKNNTHPKAKVAPPRLNGVRTGVFSTRSPHRPCPIGLSLVKIEKIVDNVIYFTGVDMIDQTPVFDIKPYIPHYDQPDVLLTQSQFDSTVEDDSEIYEITESLQTLGSTAPLPAQEIHGTRVELLAQGTSADGMVLGDGNILLSGPNETLIPPDGHSSTISSSFERGDPDGEEEEPDNAVGQTAASSSVVRVPSWIIQSPVHKLTVTFSDQALAQLRELGPELVEERSKIITNVLQEDPRSVYLRKVRRCTFYVWKIVNLCVACKFNDGDHTVQITKIFRNDLE